MFNVEKFYENCHSGDKVDISGVMEYIKSFSCVILWGASFLGKAIGESLIKNGVNIKCYWDLRYKDIIKVNDIEVVSPYSIESNPDVLLIYCIGNNVIRPSLLQEIDSKGYTLLRGDYLYEGLVCPFDKKTGITSKQCQGSMCCRAIFCQRLSNIIKSKSKKENPLHVFSITLIVNQRCSLKCKCCTSYMNAYPIEKRINIPFNRISEDIDKFFDAMDSVGTITIMGGEPFMHPDISKIVKKLLTKDNFGLISIATSGTYPIKPEQLEGMKDERVNISFSNYEQSLQKKQIDTMYESIETVKNSGISYTVGVTLAEWLIPSTLYDRGDSIEKMIEKKKSCFFPRRCMQVKNGKLHPCDFGTAVYSLGIEDCEMDYVDLENTNSVAELRNKIQYFIDQPYYKVCGRCYFENGRTSKAAEQGFIDFTKPIKH